jgi:putative heme-binding domain-containing protein
MRIRFQLLTCLILLSGNAWTTAQSIPLEQTEPTEIGLSTAGLERLTGMLEEQVESGKITGAVAAVARHGRVGYLQSVGNSDADTEMTTDTLFRIASMTKAITSAGVMSLLEEGELSLDDPLSKHLPEFATPRVLRSIDGDDLSTMPALREPTIHDLLTHRSGLTYGWFGPEKLDAIYREQNIPDLFVPISETLDARVGRIAKVPLKFQPGSAWDYGVSTDVLGRVIEVVSGLTLDQFFRERFFRPLKMVDTHFAVPPDKQSRLAGLYTIDDQQSLRVVSGEPVTAGFLKFSADYCGSENRFYSGGGGLVSSATDYLRFLQMLLSGGQLDGRRVLEPETVALMTTNQIGDMQIPFGGHGGGFGLGFGVVTDRGAAEDDAAVGSFSWGGIFNTYFWVDPQEQLVGVLMTQLFPSDHLDLRAEFKRLTYEAIDDSGFERVHWYEPGPEHANPHFNGRQLRVNAAEVSTHPKFASRSEPQSSGLARILIEEDLRKIRRADLTTEIWGGHPGTAKKRVSVNGRSTHSIPEVGAATHNCTHQYPSFHLRPIDLVNGYNSLQFACDQGETFWGHYIVDNVSLRIGLNHDDEQLQATGLSGFDAVVQATPKSDSRGFTLQLSVPKAGEQTISAIHYQARYVGYDENGNGIQTDWHGMTKQRRPYGMLGTATVAPFKLEWDTSMLPAQEGVEVRALVEFKDAENLRYQTKRLRGLSIDTAENERVSLFGSSDLPTPFWSRADNLKECTIQLEVDPNDIIAAELHVVAWTGGAGEVKNYFTLNGKPFPIAEGSGHETIYSSLSVDPSLLRRGSNKISLQSDTSHHGIEIMLPGPALMVRHRINEVEKTADDSTDQPEGSGRLRLVESAKDESAGGIDCFKIETPSANYYLDKVGAGLSSMIDRDGNDWLGFHPKQGSGAAGEYRGFPNAVFKGAGSYFHARNSSTDPCVTIVEEVTSQRIVISALSGNGLWAGRYTFTDTACTFTMTKKPEDHSYWVLYEGTPGGQYDDSDWWMTAADHEKQPLTTTHEGDLAGAEWIAFGDQQSPRMLVLSHAEDDDHPDRFYQMQKMMTVFGFGRDGMKKFLNSVPQSFSIGFVESTVHEQASQFAAGLSESVKDAVGDDSGDPLAKRRSLEQFSLTKQGDAKAGQRLFFEDQRTKCSVCHRVDKRGGIVGPDMAKIGGKFDRPHLIEALLEPSRQIVEGYRTSLIVTGDGAAHTGVATSVDEESVTLIDANNVVHKVARAEIEIQTETSVSLMPTGLADLLSPQEFTDLVSYLETLQTGNNKFGAGVAGPIQLPDGFEITTIATGLSGATALEVTPDGRVLICEQDGKLRVVKGGKLLDEPFVTIPVEHNWERGLIGVTVSPDFPSDPFVYVVYVTDQPYTHHRVSRFRAEGDIAESGSEQILLRGDDQSKFGGNVPAGHQGGAIHFGGDGNVYVGLGEQTAKTPAQRMDALQGKLLRINPDGSIPADNPFLDQTSGKYQSIWAIGCRNPFTFAFQDSTGELFINDVGGKFEEINRGAAGANYGWPTADHGPSDIDGVTGPIHIYPQASISGGDFADESSAWPESYRGQYFFADFVHGWIKTIDPSAAEQAESFAEGLRRVVDIRFAPDGSLYVLLRNAWVVDDKFEGGTGSLMRISYSEK